MSVKAELERLLKMTEEQERAQRDPVVLLVSILEKQMATMERMHNSAIEMADRQADRAMTLVDSEARKVDSRLRRGSPRVSGAPAGADHQSTTGAAIPDSPGGLHQEDLPFEAKREDIPMREVLGASDGFYAGSTGGLQHFPLEES